MLYKVGEEEFSFSYRELREKHKEMCNLSAKEFWTEQNLIDAAHLACMISYLKELGIEATISDRGIVHELIHALDCIKNGHTPEDYGIDLDLIRYKFHYNLKLA